MIETVSRPPVPAQAVCDVTIIVTCYNHQAFVEQCLESLAAQTVAPRQVIIVDDASSDASAEVIERWLAQSGKAWSFIHHDVNRGLCPTLNEALALVEGKYYCHLSADDWQEHDRLERQVGVFETLPDDVAFMVSDFREVEAGGGILVDHDFSRRFGDLAVQSDSTALLARLLSENVIPAPAVMMRTHLVRDAGGYDEELDFEDYDLWLRLATTHQMGYAPGIVASYRVVGSGMSRNPRRRARFLGSEAAMLAKHIGSTPENDATITRRLLAIAGGLLELDATTEVRTVLGYASAASKDPWVHRMHRLARRPGGVRSLKKRHGMQFGLAP